MAVPEPTNPPQKSVVAEPQPQPPTRGGDGEPSLVVSPVESGAGFGIRVVARLVDTVYGTLLGLLSGVFLGIVFAVLNQMGKIGDTWVERVGKSSVVDYALSAIGAFLYHSIAEGMGGATIGKLVCGLRVVRADGGAIDVEAGMKRSLAYYWDAFCFGIVAYTRMERGSLRQRYGDAWADTVVVKKSVYQSLSRPAAGHIVLSILLGSMLWAALVSAGVCVKVF